MALEFNPETHDIVVCGLCQCGCGGRTRVADHNDSAKGWRKGIPLRYLHGHNRHHPSAMFIPDNWVAEHGTGCWIWQRSKTANGYGTCYHDGRRDYAHRVSYLIHKGPLTSDLEIDHLCRNRSCVNPNHLEQVTRHVNAHRGIKTKLLAAQIVDIRQRVSRGESTATICSDYHIRSGYVSAICRGLRWADAAGPRSGASRLRR